MPYCHLFYHLVWATKNREKLITPEYEPAIYGYMRTKAIGLGGTVFAINGLEEHVHMAAAIPARIAVATFVGQVKGVTSAHFNRDYGPDKPFYWQEEYGAFSVDGKRLSNVIAYVENQKQHHAQQTAIPVLERIEQNDMRLVRESQAGYYVEQDTWRQEMLTMENGEG